MTDQELTALMKTPGEFPAAFGRYLRVTAALTPEGSGQRSAFTEIDEAIETLGRARTRLESPLPDRDSQT